jgi:hypothetical protein
MADGTGGVELGRRAYSSSEEASVDEVTRARIEGAEDARRREAADAEARTAAFITGARCGGDPRLSLACVAPASAAGATPAKAAGPEEAKDRHRIDAIVRPGFKDTFEGLTGEIVRLKKLSPPKTDPALGAAVNARIGELTSTWMAKAHAEGVTAPAASFDPYGASDRALRSAFLWTEVGGALPLHAAMTDGGARFRDDIFEAVALRTPGLDTFLLASYRDQPGTERALLERELVRLGDRSPCRADDSIEALRDRRAGLLRDADAAQAAIDGKIRWIGLDGEQGTFEQLVDYELEQRAVAMNPGTTLGAMTATYAAIRPGSTTEDIRLAGELGNEVQNVVGSLGGAGDVRTLGRKALKPASRGRRRPLPSGPGLGRRSRAVGASAPARTSSAAARQPTSVADKHILNGEVTTTRGKPVATGFHHEGDGTEGSARIVVGTQTAANAHGVYKGSVEMKDPATGQWVRKGAESTFFPKTWSRSEVRTAVLEAFANRTDTGNGTWEGRLANGMKVSGYVDGSGRITSAFPKFPEREDE